MEIATMTAAWLVPLLLIVALVLMVHKHGITGLCFMLGSAIIAGGFAWREAKRSWSVNYGRTVLEAQERL